MVDNVAVFELIETAVRGTPIAASIAPFCHNQNDCRAFFVIQTQHAGKNMLDKLVKEAETVLQNRKWLGTTNVTLAKHMGMHCQAYITMTECADHVPVDVPNNHLRVTHSMEWIQSTDPNILAALAAVRQDKNNKSVNFESCFAYLVVVCPVEAKIAKKGKITFQADISVAAATAPGLGEDAKKPGFGTMGSPYVTTEDAAMVDVNGLLVEQDPRPQSAIFSDADISKLYGKPVTITMRLSMPFTMMMAILLSSR